MELSKTLRTYLTEVVTLLHSGLTSILAGNADKRLAILLHTYQSSVETETF